MEEERRRRRAALRGCFAPEQRETPEKIEEDESEMMQKDVEVDWKKRNVRTKAKSSASCWFLLYFGGMSHRM